MTSSACVPIDPVEPRIATRLRPLTAVARTPSDMQQRKKRYAAQEIGVKAIEHAAVADDHPARVLHAGVTFEGGLDQVADLRGNARHRAERRALPP